MQTNDVLSQPVSRYMTTGESLRTIQPNCTVDEAFDIFRQEKIHHIPVLDDDSRLIGVVSVTDVLRLHADDETWSAKSTRVSDIMTPNIETLSPTDSMAKVAQLFGGGSFHSLLVTASDGELIGIITTSDVIRALCEPAE